MIDLSKGYPTIDAAWRNYRDLVVGRNADSETLREARLAFWTGATLLFKTIIRSLDPGEEPTERDMEMMDRLDQEINKFCESFDREVLEKIRAMGQPS